MNSSSFPKPVVICLSGGLDSTSLMLRMLAADHQVYGLSFDYGQKHRIELERLQANLDYLRKQGRVVKCEHLDLARLGALFSSALTDPQREIPEGHYEQTNMKATVVPNRNAIFASIAYGYALSLATELETTVKLGLGVHSGDHAIYPDCRPEFYEALRHAFEVGNWDSEQVEFHLPYLNWDKAQILGDALTACDSLGLDFEQVFANTCTSYLPDASGRSHGLTGSDVERILAFHEMGRQDPLEYRRPWPEVLAEALRLEREFREQAAEVERD